MILSCPSCGARYLLNPHQLGESGRRVKCARCHHVWYQQRPADTIIAAPPPRQPAAERPAEGVAAAERRPPASHPERIGLPSTELRHRRSGPAALWLFLVLIIGAGAAVAYAAREDIVRIYPPAVVVYDWLDIPLDRDVLALHDELRPGLAFTDIEVAREPADGPGDRLVITGAIENNGAETRAVAPVYARFLDAAGVEIGRWRMQLDTDCLAPGERATFQASGSDYPTATETVDFRMAE
ncbi:MAG: DUF3426 domain-containing protein [Azospirillaceae bacterium]